MTRGNGDGSQSLTARIRRALAGDGAAENDVLLELLPRLRGRARAIKSRERHDLLTDALVATAVRRALRRGTVPAINDADHFVNLLARQMRFAVIDQARERQARGEATSLEGKDVPVEADPFVVTKRMQDVLARFRELDPERFDIVWQRDGESEEWETIAQAHGISVAQAKYRYKTAVAWLKVELHAQS